MDPELKSLLAVLLDKVERIDTKVTSLDTKVTSLDTRVATLEEWKDTVATKADIARLEDEQRQMKEMLGNVRLKEIARLDGRIDQITTEMTLLRKSGTA